MCTPAKGLRNELVYSHSIMLTLKGITRTQEWRSNNVCGVAHVTDKDENTCLHNAAPLPQSFGPCNVSHVLPT